MSQSTVLLNKLIQQDAAEVKDWLRRVESDEQEPPAGFNWLGLAEAAAFDAQSASDLAWAEVALAVYERLAAKTNPSGREPLMLSSMMLRAAMIAKLGAVSSHPILDLDQIICWFERSLAMSYQEATEKAANWRNCNPEEIRELRRIKNRLQVISVLADSGKYSLNPELKAWLELREKLP
jgi:hypothetical protein